jgi:hypothetical protein
MRRLAPALALLVVGCTVGDGTGEAVGALYVKGCQEGGDFGSFLEPRYYNLGANFFAGEPIEDIKKDGDLNRIVIRLQKSGKSNDLIDLLQFDVVNSYLVATCLSGRALPDDQFRSFCQTPPGQTTPRMRIGPNLPIRSSLALRETCPYAQRVGNARDGDGARIDQVVPLPLSEWRSWIEFTAFGAATRGPVLPTFKVEFNERISAQRFHVELVDDRVVEADRRRDVPPTPDLIGVLDGNFDFELERGQGAQTFP